MLDLNLQKPQETKATGRVRQAEALKAAKEYQPTWEEVFITGYQTHTGKHKAGIFAMKNSDADVRKLKEVQQAVLSNELDAEVSDRKKFTKAHALRLYLQLQEGRKAALIEEYIANIPDNYHSVDDYDDLLDMITLAQKETEVAVDTETTGLHLENDVVVGMSITLPKADQHFYIPFLHKNFNLHRQLDKKTVLQYLSKGLFSRPDLTTAMFNAKFDLHMLLKDGLTFSGRVLDAMEAMKIINENELRYGLKPLSNKWGKYFGYTDNSLSFDELFSRDPKDFYIHADYRLCYYYACKDTHLTYLLMQFIQEQMDKQPKLGHVFHDIEVPITEVCVAMEQNGMAMDLEYAAKYGAELEAEIAELNKKITDYFGEINWNSPQQVQQKLYSEMGLKPLNDKKGTGADVLKVLAKEVPELEWLLELRGKTKLLGSFIEPIPQMVWSDSRIHGRFNQGGTKCIVGNSLIPTTDGYFKIESLINDDVSDDTFIPKELKIVNRYRELESSSHVIKYSNRKTLKLQMSHGLEIEGTPNHPIIVNGFNSRSPASEKKRGFKEKFYGQGVFKPLEDIAVGDYVAVPIGFNVFGTERQKIGIELSNAKTHVNRFTKIPAVIDEEFAEFLGIYAADGSTKTSHGSYTIQISNDDPVVIERTSYLMHKLFGINAAVSKQNTTMSTSISSIKLKEMSKYLQRGASNKRIHAKIMSSPKSVVAAYIKGHTLDSTFDIERGRLQITVKNKGNADFMQQALINMGIVVGKVYNRQADYYRLQISGKAYMKFRKDIGFIEPHKDIELDNPSNNLVKTCGEYLWVRVKEISESVADVYDLHVPETHSFIASGLISHNTGRFASDEPNMQNLPYAARPMFKAPEGKLIIGIDFS